MDMNEMAQQLHSATRMLRAPALYREPDARRALDLHRAARALDEHKLRAALVWLDAFIKNAPTERRFAVIQAWDKKRVRESWDSVVSLARAARESVEGDLH